MRADRGHEGLTWFLTQLALVATGVVLYFGTRGLTEHASATAVAHAHGLLRLEGALHLDLEQGAQRLLVGRPWVTDTANWVYIWGHWPVITATMVWLALHDRLVFLRLRNGLLVSGALGLVVFVSYPVAPPRLADLGLVDTVTERSKAYRVLQPPAFVNQYAAMPSLHFGWDLLVGLALLAAAGPLVVRVLGLLMPALMAVAVVLTGNHYVLDIVAGGALALLGHAAALHWEHRQQRLGAPEEPTRRER